MVLSCGDGADDRFARLRRHAWTLPAWNAGSTPRLHASHCSNAETTFRSGNQPRDDVANQSSSLTNAVAYYELSALRGVITRGQP